MLIAVGKNRLWKKIGGRLTIIVYGCKIRKEVIGVLRLERDELNPFSMEDAELLAPLANAAAITLSKATSLELAQEEIVERVQAEEALLESLRLIEQAKQEWEASTSHFAFGI